MSGRSTRTRLLATTTVVIAALSLTACGDEDASSVRSEATSAASTQATASPDATDATAQPSTKSPTAPATKSPSGSSGSSAGSTASGANGGKPGGTESGGTGGESRNPQCGAGTTKTVATPVARPLNHLLFTVTNVGSRSCDLLGHPYARFGEAQSVPPVDESTHPQAVVTLAPGESGYAGVRLSAADGSGTHGYSTKSLTVGFENGTVAKPSLAGKSVYVDSSLRVTYWQHTMDDALD